LIGERLYDLRKDANLTQDELAEILNINKHSISSYERNKSEPPDSIKIAIAKYFNVSVDYLLGLSDFPIPTSLQHRYLRLPEHFPDDAIPELASYMEYLFFKSKRTRPNSERQNP